MNKEITKISKFLSYVLRHKPDAIGLNLDENGWADIDQLIHQAGLDASNPNLTRDLICQAVETNDKKRFALSPDNKKIRANQGHSIQVDLALIPQCPPDILYHGTATRFLQSILKEGLKAGSRNHVHLSENIETARQVGMRYGKAVILIIDAGKMHAQGYPFFKSENGVWLTEHIPAEFIDKS